MKKPLLALIALVATSCGTASIDDRVDKIYNQLTLEERVAQLHGIRSTHLIDDEGHLDIAKCDSLIPHGVGHISQFACMLHLTPEKMRDFIAELQEYVMAHNSAGLPAIFHEEAITGVSTLGATTYPQQLGVACSWNPELVAQKSRYTAETMRSVGGQMALSPMIDVIRSQHFNRGEESYGEDSYLSSLFAKAFVEGIQGDDLRHGIAATTKHFLGYGGGSELSQKELIEEIVMPHEVAMKVAGSRALMPGYHSFDGETAITNSYFLKDILRDYLQFEGLVVSDYGAISRWDDGGDPRYYHKRATAAINAGADLELCDGICFPLLPELMEEGLVSEERFEEAVKRNLRLKVELGLMDSNPHLYDEGALDLNRAEYDELAYEMAAQSVVLLKNNGVLPLDGGDIALVGPNANSFWAMLGDYTYQSLYAFWSSAEVDGNNPKIYTLKEGLERALGRSVNYERGVDWDGSYVPKIETSGDARVKPSRLDFLVNMLRRDADATSYTRAMEVAAQSDVVIAAVGENAALCGEGRLRSGIRLPGEQQAFVEALIDSGKPVVVVLFGGRAQVLGSKILEGAAAIVQAWYPGQQGGNAVADILTGAVNPSAKLATSYPSTDSELPICYNYGEAMEGLVAFPFGHGLSYTSFEYSDLTAPRSVDIESGKPIELSLRLRNSGSRSGAEVVQLYMSSREGDERFKPLQLKGFERVELSAGESREIRFSVPQQMLSYYDVEAEEWRLSEGDFEFFVGGSSGDLREECGVRLVGEEVCFARRSEFFTESVKK